MSTHISLICARTADARFFTAIDTLDSSEDRLAVLAEQVVLHDALTEAYTEALEMYTAATPENIEELIVACTANLSEALMHYVLAINSVRERIRDGKLHKE